MAPSFAQITVEPTEIVIMAGLKPELSTLTLTIVGFGVDVAVGTGVVVAVGTTVGVTCTLGIGVGASVGAGVGTSVGTAVELAAAN